MIPRANSNAKSAAKPAKLSRGKQASKPRTRPPQERLDELMTAAQQLFLEHGVANTTVEQITTRAGVAKGTFYLYFPSKEDVLIALGERFAHDHLARITQALAKLGPDNFEGRLACWARTGVTTYLDGVKLHDMLFHEARKPTRQGLVDNIVIDHLGALLAAGNAAKAWTVDDPHLTAVFLFSGVHGMVDDAILASKHKPIPRNALIAKALEACFRAVALPPG
ncbi:TetR/AcrR family transcriptional regulator [Bradyrhizobium prioriisuperbiae]|uniref:TetR/AcrR family transcriptional regulator n=1 Tax=Bradyrhizobium prioriisuperbiae TaxID=2854389 RepID=UPI0028EA59CB|nr:TetR/AcrR family transcriptional regulator [Bradyrhizobium prioritasuperba]